MKYSPRIALAYLACLVWSCADSDRAQIERLNLTQTSPGDFTLTGLTLTTTEDTPVSGIAVVTGYRGKLTPAVTQQGALGALTFGAGTSFTYKPNKDATGNDTVVVSATDGTGTTVTATVTITITPVNDPPSLAGATTLTMAEDTSLTLTLANVTVVDPDSPSSAITLQLLPSTQYGAVGNTLRPPLNFNGDLAVSVRLSDGTASATAKLTITVTPVNDAPFVTAPTPKQTEENQAFTFDSSARVRVTDVDAGGSPILVELSADSGTITLASTTNLSFTTGDGTNDSVIHFSGPLTSINSALDGMVVTPATNFSGLITVTIKTNDLGATGAGGALEDTDTFTLGVGAVDLPPFAHLPVDFNVDEDQTFAFSGGSAVTVGDSDLPEGDSITADILVSSGTVTLSGVGGLTFALGNGTSNPHMTFTGTPAAINAAFNGMLYAPSQDYAGPVTVTLVVHSGALNDTDTLTITMNAIDDAPSITPLLTTVLDLENTTFAFTGASAITVGDVDAATGNVTMTVAATNGTVAMSAAGAVIFAGASTTTTIIADGIIADLASTIASLTFTPTTDFTGVATVSITVNDNNNTGSGGPLTATKSITVNVEAPEMPPTANADTYDTMGNTELEVTTSATGVLGNDVAGADVTVTAGTFATTLSGSVVIAADGTFTYSPPVDHGDLFVPEADTFTYTITDNQSHSATATVTIELHQKIWYVDSSSAALVPDGSSSSPFTTLDDASAAADSDTVIYVRDAGGTYGGIDVGKGVTLIGSGVALVRLPYNPDIAATASAPALRNGSSTVITLATGSTVRGVDVASNGGTPAIVPAITVTSVDDVTIANVRIHDHNRGISVDGCGGHIVIDHVTIADIGSNGIDINATKNVTVNVSSPRLTNMQSGISTNVSDGAAVNLTVSDFGGSTLLNTGVGFVNGAAGAVSTLVVRDGNFQNQPILGGNALGGTAIAVINVADTTTQVEVENTTFSEWHATAIDLIADVGTPNQITALIDQVVFGDPFGNSFTSHVIQVNPADGNADVTIKNATISNAQGVGLQLDGGIVCMDSANDDFAGAQNTDFVFNSGSIALVGYTPPGQSLDDYMTAVGNSGTHVETVLPTGAASCATVVLP